MISSTKKPVKPAFDLLQSPIFLTANSEYFDAYRHFRKGDIAPCIVEFEKAFESTIKIICHAKNWSYNQNDTATKLVDIILRNGLVPAYLREYLLSVATIRNRMAHGKGVQEISASEELGSFVLNQCGSLIKLLIESAKL